MHGVFNHPTWCFSLSRVCLNCALPVSVQRPPGECPLSPVGHSHATFALSKGFLLFVERCHVASLELTSCSLQVLLAWVEVTECSVPASPVPIPALNPPVEVSHGSCLSLQAVLAQVRDWHSSSLAVPLLQPLRTESSISLKEKEKLLLLFPL